MADPVRWGILGAANFARELMGPALHGARGGVLAALATRDASRAAPFSEMSPGLQVHDSYDALLADPDIDAVYIPLPNHLHVEWSKRAARAGKHVLCEKPIALMAADIDDLIAVRDETGRLIAEAYMIVHHPQWQRARDLIAEGAIGALHRVDGSFSYNNPDPANIRNQAAAGGGALRDIGVYILGGARFATGEEPAEILHARIDWQDGYDASAHVMARFPSFLYTGRVSMRAAPWQEMVFHGTEGLLRLPVPFNAGVFGEARVELHKGTHVQSWRFPADNHYVHQVEAFNSHVRTGAAYPCPLEFVRGTQAMMDTIFATVD